MSKGIRLKPQKWVFADKHFGFFPKRITLRVSATRPIRWIRLGIFPGFGSFKGDHRTFLFWGVLFLRSAEFRTCEIFSHNEQLDYENVNIDTHHGWAKDYDGIKSQMTDMRKVKRRPNVSSNSEPLDVLSKEDIQRLKRRRKK